VWRGFAFDPGARVMPKHLMLWSGEWVRRSRARGDLERGGDSPEGASGPRARRRFARGGAQPSSEAEIRPRGRDRGRVPDLSVGGDNFDLVVVDPHDPTTTSETRSANAIAEPTPNGYQPCRCKISVILKINSCTQSKNEQESEASNLNITRRWSLQYTKAALCGCSVVSKANL
jgi:hypothetical protein